MFVSGIKSGSLVSTYLTLKRLSLPTISPSFRHPLVLDLSSTSQSFFTTGSFNELIFIERSRESDMAASETTPPSTLLSLCLTHTYCCAFDNNLVQVYFLEETMKVIQTHLLHCLVFPSMQRRAAFFLAKDRIYVKMGHCSPKTKQVPFPV